MRWKSKAIAVILLLLAAGGANAGSLTINFDYSRDSSGFFGSGSTAKATLEKAAGDLAGIFLDDLASIAPAGGNTWTASFFSPVNGALDTQVDLFVPGDTLTVFVGARDLGTTILGQGGPGGFTTASGTSQDWFDTLYTRGQGDGTKDSVINPISGDRTAFDFGPWGGSLVVDINANWNLDHAVAPTGGQNDLYSVLVHEMAHILGVGIADSWKNQEQSGAFAGPNAVAEHGGNVPMLADFSHWDNGTMSTVYPDGASQEAAMDPDITVGTRKFFTDLDVAGMVDMGWTTIPEPSSVVLLCSAAIVFFVRTAAGRRKQKS